jgi:hypothetical protein
MRRSLPIVAGLAICTGALASTTRTAALQGNPGIDDETDYLVNPARLTAAPPAAEVSASTDDVAGGVAWAGRHALWFHRANQYLVVGGGQLGVTDTLDASLPDPGRAIEYAHASGDAARSTGFSLFLGASADIAEEDAESIDTGDSGDTGDTEDDGTEEDGGETTLEGPFAAVLGGTWGSSVTRGDVRTDVAVTAAAAIYGEAGTDGDASVSVATLGRRLAPHTVLAWGAEIGATDEQDYVAIAQLGGGPRAVGERVQVAAVVGPTVAWVQPEDTSESVLYLALPGANVAAEARVAGPLRVRGSVFAGLTIASAETALVVTPGAQGALGVGVDAGSFALDVSLSPTWLATGPYFLSGSTEPWAGQGSLAWRF